MKLARLAAPAVLVATTLLLFVSRTPAPRPTATIRPSSVPAAEQARPHAACTVHGCRADHGSSETTPVEHRRLSETPNWTEAAEATRLALGFRLGGMEHGRVVSRVDHADGRVALGIRLPSGHDLHIVRRGDAWEGRAISPSGAPGWKLRGMGPELWIEEAEHESLICSVVEEGTLKTAGLPAPARPAPGSSILTPAEVTVPPLLNSRPGANGVIYLDFDGETVTGTQWNSSYNNGAPIAAAESGLSETQIERVWQGIAEDYRPFNINITTDLAVYESYPVNRRAMLIFTPTIEWYSTSGNVGGVAYVDIFGSSLYDFPGWVFTGALFYDASNCHEAGSHEAGHILGLRHDGTSSLDYYEGHGSGATSWAPIMGVGYSRTVTQWSKGEYAGANNTEDDLAIISKPYNGLGYMADDHSGTLAGASPMAETGTDGVEASGLIETTADLDLFSFQTSGGSVNFSASNAAIDPNLDIRMRLLDAGGAQIAIADPSNSLDATLIATIPGGLYHLEVSGTGTGDATTGYSDYASLGGYTLSGTAPRVVELAARILSPSAAQISLPAGTGLYLDGLTSGSTPQWEILSTPAGGAVSLSAPGSDSTRATFSSPGLYRLRLAVASGGESASDEIEVSVEPTGATPTFTARAPGIALGGDRSIYGNRTTLAALIDDDSLPGPASFQWQVLSGDGQLSDPAIASPELVFPTASPTRLRLSVTDGDHRTFAEVRLTAVFFSSTLVAESATAATSVCDTATFGSAWKSTSYDDSAWLTGSLGAGYDVNRGNDSRRIYQPLVGTLDLEAISMPGNFAGALLRIPFELGDPNEILALTLRMKFDDGFVAYLNGTEVARSNVPAGPMAWNTLALGDRFDEDALSAVSFEIDPVPGLLLAGTNILAIHGVNAIVSGNGNKPDPEFLMLPSLEALATQLPESPFLSAVSGVDPALSGPLDDADGDGRSNLFEHATGTDLGTGDDGYSVAEMSDIDTLFLRLPQDPPSDVRYFLQHNEDLGGTWTDIAWRDGGGSWQGLAPVSGTTEAGGTEWIEFPNPAATHPRGFFRLRFELIEP